jgi:hypothetical protein
MTLSSAAFPDQGVIPARYTCEGQDVSPPLAWSGVPPGTESLVLIVDDPDAPDPSAPKTVWVHWVVYNIPAPLDRLAEGASPGSLPDGAREGLNDWKQPGYRGPCPPIGRHRYFHKLYALDAMLPDMGPITRKQLETAMESHVLGTAELMGTYQR